MDGGYRISIKQVKALHKHQPSKVIIIRRTGNMKMYILVPHKMEHSFLGNGIQVATGLIITQKFAPFATFIMSTSVSIIRYIPRKPRGLK